MPLENGSNVMLGVTVNCSLYCWRKRLFITAVRVKTNI